MSSDVVLGLSTRQNLLALQNINQQMNSAQNHLATGLAVSSAVDDAVKFFQSQSLQNRATDISTRKDQVDQGISTLTAATNGVQSVVTILQQMQGSSTRPRPRQPRSARPALRSSIPSPSS